MSPWDCLPLADIANEGQGHEWVHTIHMAFGSFQSVYPFLKYYYFNIWPSKSTKSISSHGWRQSSRLNSGSNLISDSHPFCSMSIGPPIPELWLFENLTLKIQVQGHGWGKRLRSHNWFNDLSTHILYVPCQLAIPLLEFNYFKIWPRKSNVKVIAQGTYWVQHPINSHSFRSMSIDPTILRYTFFKIWHWKFKVKITAQGHIVGATSYRFTSVLFHVNWPIPDIQLFQNLTLKGESSVIKWVWLPTHSHPMSIGHPIPIPGICFFFFQIFILKIWGYHGWDERSRSHNYSSIHMTYFFFVLHQSAQPFLWYDRQYAVLRFFFF